MQTDIWALQDHPGIMSSIRLSQMLLFLKNTIDILKSYLIMHFHIMPVRKSVVIIFSLVSLCVSRFLRTLFGLGITIMRLLRLSIVLVEMSVLLSAV